MTEHDMQNIDKIIQGYGSWFTAHLIRLIAKADVYNRRMLRKAYPREVDAVESWTGAKSTTPSTTGICRPFQEKEDAHIEHGSLEYKEPKA